MDLFHFFYPSPKGIPFLRSLSFHCSVKSKNLVKVPIFWVGPQSFQGLLLP